MIVQRAAGAAVCVACLMATPAWAQSYSFKTYDRPRSDNSYFLSINQSKHVLEQVATKAGGYGCTLVHGQNTTIINVPNSIFTQCEAINNVGTIVGFYQFASGPHVGEIAGFTYSKGSYASVSGPSGVATFVALASINNKGDVAGFYKDKGGHQIAFTLRGSRYHVFRIAGATNLIPAGLNGAGQITVEATDMNGNPVNYLLSSSGTVTLAYPGASETFIQQINDSGVAVGNYIDTSGNSHGFKYDSRTGIYTTVDDPDASQTYLIGINADETVVGSAVLPGSSVNQALIGVVDN
jgi:hypothetical protein